MKVTLTHIFKTKKQKEMERRRYQAFRRCNGKRIFKMLNNYEKELDACVN